MERANFQLAVDAALVLECGTDNQSVVKGLNKIGLPDLTRDVASASEFRRTFEIEFTTSGKFGRITYSGNMLMGDVKGQDQLKKYLKNNERVQTARAYIDYNNFCAPDLANDPSSAWQVSKHATGEVDKNGIFPFAGEMVCGGMPAMFIKHLASKKLTFAAAGNTITDEDAGFEDAGFKSGMTLIVEGSVGNNKQYLIKTVAAGVLTLDATCEAGTSVVDAAAGPEVTLHGGTL